MLTESEARDLLALAGATIEVSPVSTLPDVPRRRRWPVLAAAAAVLAVVGVGAALGLRPGDDAPAGVEPTVPRVDLQARPDVLGEGQIPSVFGYDEASATAMLESLGLDVSSAPDPMCDTLGRATRSAPPVGTRFNAGDSITLFVSAPAIQDGLCHRQDEQDLAWRLLDFANGRGPAPAFADEVWVAANDESAVIPAAMAADPQTWVDGSPLGVLRQQSREVEESTGYTFRAPILVTGPSGRGPHCHGLDLSGVPRSGPGVSISIQFLADGVSLQCTVVDVFRTDGLISAISLRTDQVPTETPAPGTVPDLIGMTEPEARSALADKGLVAEVVPPPGTKLCLLEQPAIVGTQAPGAGTQLAPGDVVTLAMRWVSCEEAPSPSVGDQFAEGQRLASAFLYFALGARAQPPVDTPVNLYLGNELIRVLDSADASDRDAWDVCPDSGGYAEATCPFNATRALAGGADDFATSGTLPAASVCPVELAPPPTNVGGPIVGSITIGPTTVDSITSCMDYVAVIIYANDVGQITGVNLLLGSP